MCMFNSIDAFIVHSVFDFGLRYFGMKMTLTFFHPSQMIQVLFDSFGKISKVGTERCITITDVSVKLLV